MTLKVSQGWWKFRYSTGHISLLSAGLQSWATGSQPDNHQSLINELDVDIFINDIDPNFSVNVETRATENSRFES